MTTDSDPELAQARRAYERAQANGTPIEQLTALDKLTALHEARRNALSRDRELILIRVSALPFQRLKPSQDSPEVER